MIKFYWNHLSDYKLALFCRFENAEAEIRDTEVNLEWPFITIGFFLLGFMACSTSIVSWIYSSRQVILTKTRAFLWYIFACQHENTAAKKNTSPNRPANAAQPKGPNNLSKHNKGDKKKTGHKELHSKHNKPKSWEKPTSHLAPSGSEPPASTYSDSEDEFGPRRYGVYSQISNEHLYDEQIVMQSKPKCVYSNENLCRQAEDPEVNPEEDPTTTATTNIIAPTVEINIITTPSDTEEPEGFSSTPRESPTFVTIASDADNCNDSISSDNKELKMLYTNRNISANKSEKPGPSRFTLDPSLPADTAQEESFRQEFVIAQMGFNNPIIKIDEIAVGEQHPEIANESINDEKKQVATSETQTLAVPQEAPHKDVFESAFKRALSKFMKSDRWCDLVVAAATSTHKHVTDSSTETDPVPAIPQNEEENEPIVSDAAENIVIAASQDECQLPASQLDSVSQTDELLSSRSIHNENQTYIPTEEPLSDPQVPKASDPQTEEVTSIKPLQEVVAISQQPQEIVEKCSIGIQVAFEVETAAKIPDSIPEPVQEQPKSPRNPDILTPKITEENKVDVAKASEPKAKSPRPVTSAATQAETEETAKPAQPPVKEEEPANQMLTAKQIKERMERCCVGNYGIHNDIAEVNAPSKVQTPRKPTAQSEPDQPLEKTATATVEAAVAPAVVPHLSAKDIKAKYQNGSLGCYGILGGQDARAPSPPATSSFEHTKPKENPKASAEVEVPRACEEPQLTAQDFKKRMLNGSLSLFGSDDRDSSLSSLARRESLSRETPQTSKWSQDADSSSTRSFGPKAEQSPTSANASSASNQDTAAAPNRQMCHLSAKEIREKNEKSNFSFF